MKFRLHWIGEDIEDIEGSDIADAFNRAGYSHGALRALDYFEEVKS